MFLYTSYPDFLANLFFAVYCEIAELFVGIRVLYIGTTHVKFM